MQFVGALSNEVAERERERLATFLPVKETLEGETNLSPARILRRLCTISRLKMRTGQFSASEI